MHNRTNDCASWAPHGEDGWYIGPAMEHYRCHKEYNPKTRAERISDTVESPKKYHMPRMSSVDATYHTVQDLIYILHNPSPTSPLVKLGIGHKEALKTLVNIFIKAIPPVVPTRVPVREVYQKKPQ